MVRHHRITPNPEQHARYEPAYAKWRALSDWLEAGEI
jgi:sugar (pentulose or hexulose) kinase